MGLNSMQAGGAAAEGDRALSGGPLGKMAEAFSSALGGLGESERYQLLAELLLSLAHAQPTGDNGRISAEQAKELARKVQTLDKTRAELEDQLRSARDDLRDRESRLATEQTRVADLQSRVEAQRQRLEPLEKERAELDAQLVARNAELHAAERAREDLLIQMQRAGAGAEDRRQVQSLEQECTLLRAQLTEAREESQRLREEKNARISQLEEELRAAKTAGEQGTGLLPQTLWNRLVSANLAGAGSLPTPQSVQRVVEVLIETAGFVCEFDKTMRVFLSRYARRRKELNLAWQGYTGGDGLQQLIQKVLSPGLGVTTVQGLRGKLKICNRWVQANLTSCDATLESLCDVLRDQLKQFVRELGNKATVAEFLDKSGHDSFQARIAELQSKKLEDVFSLGV